MKISTILEADNSALLTKLKSAVLQGVPAGCHKVSLSDVQLDKDSLSVRYWGKWEMPEGEEDDGDYDWEVLSKSSQAQLKSVVTKFEKKIARLEDQIKLSEAELLEALTKKKHTLTSRIKKLKADLAELKK